MSHTRLQGKKALFVYCVSSSTALILHALRTGILNMDYLLFFSAYSVQQRSDRLMRTTDDARLREVE